MKNTTSNGNNNHKCQEYQTRSEKLIIYCGLRTYIKASTLK